MRCKSALVTSRPNTVPIYYARVLDKSADSAASLVSGQLSGAPVTAEAGASIDSGDLPAIGSVAASVSISIEEFRGAGRIEPTHKGFAVFAVSSNQLINWDFSSNAEPEIGQF
jgi:hypothetical protein